MKRTKILTSIILVLISLIVLVVVTYKREIISDYIVKIVKKVSQKNIIIPEESYNHRTYDYKSVSETDNFKPKDLDELKNVYYTFLNNGWNNFTFYCDVNYDNCKDDAEMLLDDQEIKQINDIVDKFIADNNLSSDLVTKSDIKLIHDYLIENVTYDDENADKDELVDSNKASGALVNKVALCSGYTDAFAIFMDKLGVPNFNISTEDHVWNVIYFDGKWRHIDVTWDDDEVNKNNNYNFYMINTDELLEKDKESHNFNQDLYLELK